MSWKRWQLGWRVVTAEALSLGVTGLKVVLDGGRPAAVTRHPLGGGAWLELWWESRCARRKRKRFLPVGVPCLGRGGAVTWPKLAAFWP